MIILLLLQLSVIYSKLAVVMPPQLQGQFSQSNMSIPYSVANFGEIPWGRKIIGSLGLGDPIDGCSGMQAANATFVLVKRGNCTFVTKVRNAQLAGYRMAIIVDNLFEATDDLTMSDDGYGYTVHIPSVFIGESDGEILENFLLQQMIKQSLNQSIQEALMVIKFDVNIREDTSVIFALTLKDRESFKLMDDFIPYFDQLKDQKGITINYLLTICQVTFQICYDLYTCPHCIYENFTLPQQDCLGGGRYCALDPDGDKIGTGRDVLEEILRQLCIFQTDQSKWFQYLNVFDQDCVLPQAYASCSEKKRRQLKIDETKVQTCFRSSFNTSSSRDYTLQTNSLLDQQLNLKMKSGVKYYPGAIINNQSYLGEMEAKDIFGDICNSMLSPPQSCKSMLDNYTDKPAISESNLAAIIIFVIAIMIVFFLFMVFIYRRMVRKEMSKEMSGQVNQMVSQYISFYETKERK